MAFLQFADSAEKSPVDIGGGGIIGRAPDALVPLSDRLTSRHHAEILHRDGRYVIVDLVSRYGTFVNGNRVRERVLEDGDDILIGGTRLRFEALGEVDATTQPVRWPPCDSPLKLPKADAPESMEQLTRDYTKLRMAFELWREIRPSRDPLSLLELLLRRTVELLQADRGTALLFSSDPLGPDSVETQPLESALEISVSRHGNDAPLRLSRSILFRVLTEGAGVVTGDAVSDQRFEGAESVLSDGIRSAMCVPMRAQGNLLGLIQVDSLVAHNLFKSHDLELLTALADEVAMAFQNQKVQEQLARQERLGLVGEMAAGIAHDFNNLLSVILANATLALDGNPAGELREDLEEIERAARLGAKLADRLLVLGRSRPGKVSTIVLNDLLGEVESLLRRTLDARIALMFRLAEDVWPISADPVSIEQVLLNLAFNARDAMPNGGQLLFETHNVALDEAVAAYNGEVHPGRWVRLDIIDNGTGMTPETFQHAFEPLFTTKKRGAGLGLSTVARLVNETGGQVGLQSVQGVGTRFAIWLPASTSSREPSSDL